MPPDKTVKIFLASSEELVEDRKAFNKLLADKNKQWINKGIFFESVVWEDFLDSVSETRKQDDYNRALQECDLFVLLFFSKVGKYTEEEFDTAYLQFTKTGRPQIFTYFKDAEIKMGKIDDRILSMLSFKKKLAELDHFFSVYENKEGLKLHFYDQLEKLYGGTALPLQKVGPSEEWLEKYLTDTLEDLKHVKVPIPIGDQSKPLELEDVYVPLQIRSAQFTTTTDDPKWSDLLNKDRVAITGDAGCGKSTLLRYIALKTAQNNLRKLMIDAPDRDGEANQGKTTQDEIENADLIPIFIDLAKSMDILEGAQSNRAEISPERWLEFFKDRLFTLSQEQVESLFKEGNVLFLFDGLDEVPEPDDRKILINGIATLQRAFNPLHARNKVFVACRSAAWEHNNEFVRFERADLQPMDPSTYLEYLKKWCQKVWGKHAQVIYDSLTQSISASRAVAQIVTNPQMTTMLSLVQGEPQEKDEGILPRQRALLYERFVEKFIKTGTGTLTGDRDVVREHLMALALEMQRRQNQQGEPLNSISAQEASNLLGKRLTKNGHEETSRKVIFEKGEALLHALEVHTGLLEVDRSTQLSQRNCFVRFKHRTFQEYLAACHFAEGTFNDLLDHAADPGWAETIAMTCGLLSQFDEEAVKELLQGLLLYEQFPEGSKPTEQALTKLAPRVAAATICFFELASYDLKKETLKPIQNAHELVLPLLKDPNSELGVETRVKIAEGLGSVYDPRLKPDERWVKIPAGKFFQGTEISEAWTQESPIMEVALETYKIQRWPVTIAEFSRFIDEGGYREAQWWVEEEAIKWRDDHEIIAPLEWDKNALYRNRPVTGVSYWEAMAYCRWYAATDTLLQQKWHIQLPSESQWERAAGNVRQKMSKSGEEQVHFPWGSEWLDEAANYSKCGPATPVSVGVFPAGNSEPYGLWDMAGNVNEWCLDRFGPYRTNGNDLPNQYLTYVIRGGSFRSNPLDLRITNRFGMPPGERDDGTGFRCVATPKN